MSRQNKSLQPVISDLPDPNIPQKRASDPESSVWVNASAGTGKTKVLTDRVLRLLLPSADGRRLPSPANRILCITFTKAAASEMASRINKILAEWAVISDQELVQELTDLLTHVPSAGQIKKARRLFSDVIDAPGGLKIMTIHAFCQSVLGRFPLEADISPNFSVLDEAEALKLVNAARRKVLNPERLSGDPVLDALMGHLAAEKNESQLGEILMALLGERLQLRRALQGVSDRDDLYSKLCIDLGCSEKLSIDLPEDRLWDLSKAFQSYGGKAEQDKGAKIQSWLESNSELRLSGFHHLVGCFLNKDGSLPKKIATKGLLTEQPEIEEEIIELRNVIAKIDDQIKNQKLALITADLLFLGHQVLAEYKNAKSHLGVLDYEDLIFKTYDLLSNPESARWVLFKLDGGLDHLLIDEAQDTNPEQWEIIDALAAEFFSGHSARDQIERTIFTVGDEKQSIYSFQRADPEAYQSMRHHFRGQIEQASKNWADVDMTISFRSTAAVLDLVDKTFEAPHLRQTLGPSYHSAALKHYSFRSGHAGRTEIWPIIEPEEQDEKPEGWQLPLAVKRQISPEVQLAEMIASEVKQWIREGRILPSKGRPIHAGDVLVLVGKRTKFVGPLLTAFKKWNLPVAGVDRLRLKEQIAIMDLLALAQISILPEDDLTLASLLKSPFVGLKDEDLFGLCYGRKATLWQSLKSNENYKNTVSWIQRLARSARKERPYEFFSMALNTECPKGSSGLSALTARLGKDCEEPINEFLSLSIHYEQENIPSVQGYMNWFNGQDTTIKREMDEAGREIRIMTVHGAKGLQAPIVFMPDTLKGKGAPREGDNLLWPAKTGRTYPLYAPRKDEQSSLFKDAKAKITERLDAEYNRLLYVAMTRAEDELYICAAGKEPQKHRDSWYHMVEDAFMAQDIAADDQGRRVYITEQSVSPKQDKIVPLLRSESESSIPDWIHEPPEAEALPPRPLTPSKPDEEEPAVHSPLEAENTQRFLRGNITHKLLELLPDLPEARWLDAATLYVADEGRVLSDRVQKSVIEETLRVLTHPEFSPVFGEGSRAEVPVTGLIGNQIISAQIDRMVVTEDTVFIVDFKTNRPSPDEAPKIYKDQLVLYAKIMAQIYPDKTVRTALLWTDKAALMEVPCSS